MENQLMQLMNKYRKGSRSVFNLWPFLSLEMLKQNGLDFNDVLQNPHAMAAAALFGLEIGFEATILPFDLNVEAEVLGAGVCYHDAVDGNPIYPTIGEKSIHSAEDIAVPEDPATTGRIPQILDSIRTVREKADGRGALGISLPGPFTLAGQVMDMDKMFIMVLKKPDQAHAILERLTGFLIRLREIYLQAGVELVSVKEGGACNISPKALKNVLLPHLETLFTHAPVPQTLSLPGKADRSMEAVLRCGPDAVVVDQECNIGKIREIVPETTPLFWVCGPYDMLASADPATVKQTVLSGLKSGVTSVIPPADVYPPARNENIRAFIDTVRDSTA